MLLYSRKESTNTTATTTAEIQDNPTAMQEGEKENNRDDSNANSSGPISLEAILSVPFWRLMGNLFEIAQFYGEGITNEIHPLTETLCRICK